MRQAYPLRAVAVEALSQDWHDTFSERLSQFS
jgi:hypothetical protein